MQQKSVLCMSTKRAAKLRPKGTFGKRLPGAGAAKAAEAVVGMCHRRQHHTGQTISLIMKNLLIAISNSATISSEELIAELHNVWSYENTTMRRANSDY